MKKILLLILIILVLVVAGNLIYGRNNRPVSSMNSNQTSQNQNLSATSSTTTSPQIKSAPSLVWPISDAQNRVTKKPFGIYITPKTSPVQPERFIGYHTGVDFETYPSEQNTDVAISAVCKGKLLVKRYASGYGGVAVQACKINGADYTIIYGHLRLSSITPNVGDELSVGQQFAVLGTGYSSETDGERKHLHLGVHKGTSINIMGYVQNKSDLDNWVDFRQLMNS